MTDEPTTPAAERCPSVSPTGKPCELIAGHEGLHGHYHVTPWHTSEADRVTALTLQCGDLRAQRDEARAELAALRAGIAHRDANSASVDPSATPDELGPQIDADGLGWRG